MRSLSKTKFTRAATIFSGLMITACGSKDHGSELQGLFKTKNVELNYQNFSGLTESEIERYQSFPQNGEIRIAQSATQLGFQPFKPLPQVDRRAFDSID
ncbi:MAG: hypothetical protein M3Q07_18705 [Pseudobdellovibrionaceae bacterium]|nr:hypothetical protein [Pseudobdellovibrionaceae bacterium]